MDIPLSWSVDSCARQMPKRISRDPAGCGGVGFPDVGTAQALFQAPSTDAEVPGCGYPTCGSCEPCPAAPVIDTNGIMTGAELRGIRERLGLTQAAFGELVGVRRNTVARWEREERSINEPVARLIERLAAERGAQTTRKEDRTMQPTRQRKKGGR